MPDQSRAPVLLAAAILLALVGVALVVGGAWLIRLGGSWYYLVAGLALLLTAVLLWRRQPAALGIYALLVLGTLAWAWWEVGLDWWPLAARGDLIFVLGFLLLTPWVTRKLGHDGADRHRASAFRGQGLALTTVLGVALVVAVLSWFTDPHRLQGQAPAARAEVSPDALGVPPGEWPAYGRTDLGRRWSPLAQITPDNVTDLEVAWTYRTGDVRGPSDPTETTFEVTPLKIGNRLYLCTPHQNVIALDATTGAEIWRYDPKIENELALQHLTCRGLAYDPGGTGPAATATPSVQVAAAEGGLPDLPVAAADAAVTDACATRLFMPTADGRLIALDPETGAVCKDFGDGSGQIDLWANMPNVRPGAYYSTSPPVVAQGLVIVGGTVLDNVSTHEQSGVIRGFDARTGALVWAWDSGNPDRTAPLPPGQTYTANSPNSWSIASADPELGLTYWPLGNQPPDQWGGSRSAAVERFSSSVVALEIATGKVRWAFQTVHHDLWDYDVPSQPSLVDLTVDGQTVPALVQPTKQGELFVLDRRTGRPVLPVREQPAPQGAAEGDHAAPTQPVSALSFDPPPLSGRDMWGATLLDQLACRIQFHRLRYEGRFTPPSTQGSLIYPGNFGVFNWGGVAVDPARQIAFTTPAYLAFVSRLVPRANDTTLYVQGDDRPEGSLPALNENFGAPFAAQLHPFTSVLGIPCQAPPWGYVAAADLTTGEILWMHKNGTVRDLSPIPLPFAMGVPDLGGPIVTAGGVGFLSGTLDYYVRGYDVATGRELWRHRLPAGGQATPMTYSGEDGRQYLIVVAGGHGSLGTKAGDSVDGLRPAQELADGQRRQDCGIAKITPDPSARPAASVAAWACGASGRDRWLPPARAPLRDQPRWHPLEGITARLGGAMTAQANLRAGSGSAVERWRVLRRLESWLETPMLVLSLAWLLLVLAELIWGAAGFLETFGTAIWVVFIAEFALRFTLAPAKGRFLRRNWLTALALLAPALRLVGALRVLRVARAARSLRLVRIIGTANRTMGALRAMMRRRGLGYVLVLTMLVTLLGAGGMLAFEPATAVAGGFEGFWDALWWTAMLVSTMGSAYWPQTPEGRLLCLLLSLYGLAVFGYITASFASFFVGRDHADQPAARTGEFAAIRSEIAALRVALEHRHD